MIVWPAGGAIVAVTLTGLVTTAPSAGDGAVIDGGGGALGSGLGDGFGPPPAGALQVTLPRFEIWRRPPMNAPAWMLSVPACTPT